MYTIGNQIKKACKDIDGITDLNVEQQIERPELKIVPRRELLARNGITLPEFNEFLAIWRARPYRRCTRRAERSTWWSRPPTTTR